MRNFKRALASTLAFLLCFALLIGIATFPYFTKESYYYQDAKVRQALAGQFDLLISGASHGLRAIIPQTLDETLGCASYNLCGTLEPMRGRYELLRRELERNPVSTVILELSYDSITRTPDDHGFESNIYQLGREETPAQWLSYFFSAVPLKDYVPLLRDCVERGVSTWKRMLAGELKKPAQYETHGFVPYDTVFPMPTADTYTQYYHTDAINTTIHDESLEYLEKILALCQGKDIQVILIVVPISEHVLWKNDGYDTVLGWYQELSETWGCPLYDFNLKKDKLERYPQADSYTDDTHMSAIGASAFSQDLAQVLRMARDGLDTQPLFYETYDEAIHARGVS